MSSCLNSTLSQREGGWFRIKHLANARDSPSSAFNIGGDINRQENTESAMEKFTRKSVSLPSHGSVQVATSIYI